ncbi:hypothetical protein CkaCkLH20_12477 [Colletotrichum karsti]|uniref:Protein kinase domain-containing protein n=1 Tax=Colletotrichum karsti TaxID=1095194 RepID=A0A9P6HSJ5_9PEZI|nr:uncharacterized protein CkaCkLH20_12477 [Colletotrichum karsti]KAF9869997.1 hypothetical protein CkaCkLH20_12477 [Colletotrichum karsti]
MGIRRSDSTVANRFEAMLIKILADRLERLHAVNWLHKGLRSQSILFSRDADTAVDCAQPFLSRFDYSRPENADFMSEAPPHIRAEDVYRHPAVQGGPRDDAHGFGFKKHHGISSLGIIMMEIACWNSVDVVLGFEERRVRLPSETAGVRETLLSGRFDDNLRGHMGDVVAEIVKSCLAGPDNSQIPIYGADASRSGLKLQEWFFHAVAKKLRDMRI